MQVDGRQRAEIESLGLAAPEPPDVVEHLLHAARLITGAPRAQLNVVTDTEQVTLVDADGRSTRVPVADSVCARVLDEDVRDVQVPDASTDPRYADVGVVARGELVGYAASQLVTSDGVTVGTVCVFSDERLDLAPHMVEALHEVGRSTVAALEARRTSGALELALQGAQAHRARLDITNEHLSSFAGQVAHDLQGPLATIVFALQCLQDELVEDDAPLLLDTALSGTERLQHTVSALLEFATLGGVSLPVSVVLDEVVAEVLEDLVVEQGRTEVVVADLPVVSAVPTLLRAVLLNLLGNAFKYAGDVPDPKVSVWAGPTTGGWRLEVQDNGPGVLVEQRERIFEPMARGDLAADRRGTGIGLATCRRVAQAHGGSIGVDEAPLGGARFWLEWPAEQSDPGL